MPEKIPSSVMGFYDGIFHFYDAANTLLTFGLDRFWRRAAARAVLAGRPARILDICCGTGALVAEIKRLSPGGLSITGLDFSEPMLSIARARAAGEGVEFVKGDASALPFADSSFDAVAISLATRNLLAEGKELSVYFSEFRRVLKPGGTFVHLETSRPACAFTRFFFKAYVKTSIAAVSALFPKGRRAYRFLASSILSFYPPEDLSQLLLNSGFTQVQSRPLTLGALSLHTAKR